MHTCSQVLGEHVHIHVLIPAVGLSIDDPHTIAHCPEDRFLPKDWLMREYRTQFIKLLRKAMEPVEDPDYDAGNILDRADFDWEDLDDAAAQALTIDELRKQLTQHRRKQRQLDVTGPRCRELGLDQTDVRNEWLDGLAERVWIVRSPPAIDEPKHVVEYFARYTQKSAISNQRIFKVDLRTGTVHFYYRNNHPDDDQRGEYGGQREETTMPVLEFIDRFLKHVFPAYRMRIRYWGFMASAKKRTDYQGLRALLGMEPWKDAREEKAQQEKQEQEQGEENDGECFESEDRAAVCPMCKERELRLLRKTQRPALRTLMRGLENHWHRSRGLRAYRRRRYKRLQARHDKLQRYLAEAQADLCRDNGDDGTCTNATSGFT